MSARIESLRDAGYTFCAACYAEGKDTAYDLIDISETELIDGERYCRPHVHAITSTEEAQVSR